MKYPVLTAVLALLMQFLPPLAAGAANAPAATAPSSADASYGVGLTFGEQLRRAGVTNELSIESFAKGVKDALAGKATTAEDRERLQAFVKGVRETVATRNHAAAKDYLAKNAQDKDVHTTASGLQYKVLSAGDAKADSPKPSDEVTVHYRGKLLDGTEFDSSYTRGQPATFRVSGVIPGWQEALSLMKPGAKWQVAIPPELAYDMNSPPVIPPGSALLFDVELISVKAGTAPAAATAP